MDLFLSYFINSEVTLTNHDYQFIELVAGSKKMINDG